MRALSPSCLVAVACLACGALFIDLVGDASAEACGRHGLSIACPAR